MNNQNEQISLFMKKLDISEQEAIDLLNYDKQVQATSGGLEFDLSKEQSAIAKKYTITTGAKKEEKSKKAPTAYKFDKRTTKKPNETKSEIIAKLAELMEQFSENLEIVNPERQIKFSKNGNDYELTLVQKRKAK